MARDSVVQLDTSKQVRFTSNSGPGLTRLNVTALSVDDHVGLGAIIHTPKTTQWICLGLDEGTLAEFTTRAAAQGFFLKRAEAGLAAAATARVERVAELMAACKKAHQLVGRDGVVQVFADAGRRLQDEVCASLPTSLYVVDLFGAPHLQHARKIDAIVTAVSHVK